METHCRLLPFHMAAIVLQLQIILKMQITCCHTAGLSSWTSSVTVINEMLKSRPDLVKVRRLTCCSVGSQNAAKPRNILAVCRR